MASKLNRTIITLTYLSMGWAWITFSNTLLAHFYVQQPKVPPFIEMSHWLFLGVSTCCLYLLLYIWNSQQAKLPQLQPHHKLKQALPFFREYSSAMAKSGDKIAFMNKACEICVEEGGQKLAWIASAENDRIKSLKPITHYGDAGCFFDDFHATWDNSEKGKCPAGTSIRIGESIIYQDLLANSRFKHRRETAKRCGFGSCISIPLWDEFNITGALIVFNSATHAYDLETVNALEELANGISAATTNARKTQEHTFAMDEHHMLAAITEQTTDGVLTFNPEGIIQYINSSFIELCRIPLNNIIGVSIHDFDCCKRNPIFYQTILNAVATKSTKVERFVSRNSSGEEINIDTQISPVFDNNNRLIRYVTTVRDITKEVQLQLELQQSQQMEALATLSETIIHAFQKQLLTISNHSKEGLTVDADNGAFQEKFLSIFKATQNGNRLIDHFTAISQQSDQPKQLINIANLVNRCIDTLLTKTPTTIKIGKKISANNELVSANKKQIYLVIMNLCTNAIDAMQSLGGTLEIGLFNANNAEQNNHSHPLLSPEHIKLTITDTGQGMNSNEIDSIFDPFYTTKGQNTGLGMGLSISQRIIKDHGGDIFVNSIVGVGTSFAITLPRYELAEEDEPKYERINPSYLATRDNMFA